MDLRTQHVELTLKNTHIFCPLRSLEIWRLQVKIETDIEEITQVGVIPTRHSQLSTFK